MAQSAPKDDDKEADDDDDDDDEEPEEEENKKEKDEDLFRDIYDDLPLIWKPPARVYVSNVSEHFGKN